MYFKVCNFPSVALLLLCFTWDSCADVSTTQPLFIYKLKLRLEQLYVGRLWRRILLYNPHIQNELLKILQDPGCLSVGACLNSGGSYIGAADARNIHECREKCQREYNRGCRYFTYYPGSTGVRRKKTMLDARYLVKNCFSFSCLRAELHLLRGMCGP